MPSSAVGTLPHRTPGASGYQQWISGDLRRVDVFTPAMDVPPMDPEDPEAWAHVAEVMNRPPCPGREGHPKGGSRPDS